MRPVNLIPPDERRGDSAPMRLGVLSYVLLGALAVGLIGVIAMALTSKSISDKESEKVTLEQDLASATERAESLRSFADFRAVQETRTATISSLAQSRFDWERVLNELAHVIPSDVWLLKMTGTVSPNVQIDGGAEIGTRESVAGPALEVVGCAPDQDAVAGFIASLEDIDGVTRVGLSSSMRPDSEQTSGGVTSGSGEDTTDDCRTESFIYQFELVVAFDAVPAPATATTAPSVPAPVAPGTAPEGAQLAAGATSTPSTAAPAGASPTPAPGG